LNRMVGKKSKNGLLILSLALGAISGCGGGGGGGGGNAPPPAPVMAQISPSSGSVGCGAVNLTVSGSNFGSSSVVQWNGNTVPTTLVSSTQLTAVVPSSDISTAGTESVTVSNSGTVSNALTFTANSGADAVAFQINPGHSGSTTFACNVTLPTQSAWAVNLGGTPSFALIAGGKVFVTVAESGVSTLIALDQATGATAWGPIELSQTVSAAYDAGQVFVVNGGFNNNAIVSAYNAATGTKNWSASLPGQYSFSSGVTAANGYVYTGGAGEGGTVYALNEASGALSWTAGVANGDDSTPAVTSTGVYVSYPCLSYALAPATGSNVWTHSSGCDGGGGGTPVVANGVLYSPSGNGGDSGTTFNASTGAVLGTYTADYLPSIDANNGYFLQSGTLRGISLANNTVLWSFAGDGGLTTSPITVNQYTFIGSTSGQLYAVNNATGQQVWNMNVGYAFPHGATWDSGIPLTGLSAGDGLLVVPSGNSLIAYSLVGAN
jgi:outer membrane protein assembly factor BamB